MSSIKMYLFFILSFSLLMACGNEGPKPQKNSSTSEVKKAEIKNEAENKVKSQDQTKSVEPKADGKKEATAKNDQVDEGVPPEQLKKAKSIIKGVKKKQIAEVDTKKKFKMHCATCHGFKGNMAINGAKKLTLSKISLEESVAQVYFGKGLMTPFKDVLTEVEIVAVAKYIEEFRK